MAKNHEQDAKIALNQAIQRLQSISTEPNAGALFFQYLVHVHAVIDTRFMSIDDWEADPDAAIENVWEGLRAVPVGGGDGSGVMLWGGTDKEEAVMNTVLKMFGVPGDQSASPDQQRET